MAVTSLKEYGLSDKESKVYLAILELGSGSVSEIAFRAKINRTTAYDILEALISYGLVSYLGEEKKKHYVAESPERLSSYLEKKSREIKEKSLEVKTLMPELQSIFNLSPQKPKVKYYEGEDGIISMYEDSLSATTGISSWLNTDKTYGFSADYFADYYKRRAAKGIHMRTIINDIPLSHQIATRDIIEDRESRIIPKEMMDIEPECYVYENKVAFMSLREKFGVMIESRDIADAMTKLFELAWGRAGEIKINRDKK
jgi:sugar-specific transcriptional regulator TrmB